MAMLLLLLSGHGAMTTKLTEPLKREIEIDGEPYTVLLTPLGVRFTRKRFREGRLVTWRALRDQDDPVHVAAP